MTDIVAISHSCLTAVNRAIYRELLKKGWSVQLVIPQKLAVGSRTKIAEPDGPGDPIIHRLPLSGLYSRLWRYDGLTELLEQLQPRIILAENEPGSLIAFRLGRWAHRRGAHLVCQSCENILKDYRKELANGDSGAAISTLVARTLSALASPCIDHVFVISSDGIGVMETQGYRGRVSQIPLGYDANLFYFDQTVRENTRQRLGLRDLTFAVFGRMVRQKGIHLLIDALVEMKDRSWQLLLDRFELFHSSDYSDEIKDMIRENGLESRVVYFDASHADMPAYMMASDVVVAPTLLTPKWKEQYGRVVVEAMACGRLVMVAENGTMPELVGDAGITFPPNDVHSLALALERVFDRPELVHRFGFKAAQRASRSLSVAAQVEKMTTVFDRLTHGAVSKPSPQKRSDIAELATKERIDE